MGTKLTQEVEGVAKQQILEPRKMRQPESWGYSWNVCVVVVGPGPENEIEEIAKMDIERRGQRALGLASLGPRSMRMVPLVPEAWMEAQPASELHFAGFAVPGLGKLPLESCCQQARCHLSVETLGAAPGLRLGLLSSPQWA